MYSYRCPTCGALKEIEMSRPHNDPPVDLVCGVRGCPDRATREAAKAWYTNMARR